MSKLLEPLVEGVAKHYLWYLGLGIIPLLLFSVIRSLFDALGLTKLSMYLMLLLLPLNGIFNYVLIYGAFGFPEMGGAGSGLGTSLSLPRGQPGSNVGELEVSHVDRLGGVLARQVGEEGKHDRFCLG